MRRTTLGFLHYCDEIGLAENAEKIWIGAFEKLLKDSGKQNTLDGYFVFLRQLQTADEIANELDSMSELAHSSQDKNVQDAVVMVDSYVRSGENIRGIKNAYMSESAQRVLRHEFHLHGRDSFFNESSLHSVYSMVYGRMSGRFHCVRFPEGKTFEHSQRYMPDYFVETILRQVPVCFVTDEDNGHKFTPVSRFPKPLPDGIVSAPVMPLSDGFTRNDNGTWNCRVTKKEVRREWIVPMMPATEEIEPSPISPEEWRRQREGWISENQEIEKLRETDWDREVERELERKRQQEKRTPGKDSLGCYVVNEGVIYIWIDRILRAGLNPYRCTAFSPFRFRAWKELPCLLLRKVLLHEYIHALFHIDYDYNFRDFDFKSQNSTLGDFNEETVDNALVLCEYLLHGSIADVGYVRSFMLSQPYYYALALKAFPKSVYMPPVTTAGVLNYMSRLYGMDSRRPHSAFPGIIPDEIRPMVKEVLKAQLDSPIV